MKKHIAIAASIGFAFGAFISCDDSKQIEYVPATPVPGDEVAYFDENVPTAYDLLEDDNTIEIPVHRNFTEGEYVVKVTVTPEEAYDGPMAYTFPEEIVFADGEDTATYTVTYDYSLAEKGETQVYYITMDDKDSTPYRLNYISLSLTKPAWTILGNALFTDYGVGVQVEVALGQSDNNPNMFRLENPYYDLIGNTTNYLVFQLLTQGEEYTVDYFGEEVPVTSDGENNVGFQTCYATVDSGIDFYIVMPQVLEALGYLSGMTGQYSYVLDYQENGLPNEIHLSPIYWNPEGYWFGDTSKAESISILFPGGVSVDTSLEIEYDGLYEDDTIAAIYLAEVGNDLTSVKLAIEAGADADAIATGIQNGTIDSVEAPARTGEVEIPFNFTSAGRYTAVAVGYIDDTPRSVASVAINYAGKVDPTESWTSLGYVDYTDGYMTAQPFYLYPTSVVNFNITYPVEIEESDSQKGLYRLVNPYGAAYPLNDEGDWDASVDSYLYINATDPKKVTILDSPQTLLWQWDNQGKQGFGLEMCMSYAQMLLDDEESEGYDVEGIIQELGLYGTYANGKITFEQPYLAQNTETLEYVIMTPLLAQWSFIPDPQYSGIYGADLLISADNYEATDGEDPYVYNDDGTFYGPFCVDMNSLTQTPTRSGKMTFKAAGANGVTATVSLTGTRFDRSFLNQYKKALKKDNGKKQFKAMKFEKIN